MNASELISELAFVCVSVCVWGGGGGLKPRPISITAARWNIVRARSKQSKEDSLPQETGRAQSSRYVILLKVKCVCRLDQNTVTMALHA